MSQVNVAEEMLKIAELLGELMEDVDFECDQVDQSKQMFLMLDPDKVREVMCSELPQDGAVNHELR